jgi:hypothetical protein
MDNDTIPCAPMGYDMGRFATSYAFVIRSAIG